jgi:MFS family permease
MPLAEQLARLRGKLVRMKPLVPGMVLQTAAAGLLVPILPSFATGHLQLTYSEYSLVLIAAGVVTAGCLIPMGRLSDRWGLRLPLIAGFAAMALALFLMPHARSIYGALPLAVMLGFAYSAVLPAWNALMSRYVPDEQKATGWGVLSGIEGLGVMIGPVAGGALAHRFGEAAAVGLSALLLLTIAVFYLLFPIKECDGRTGNSGIPHGPSRQVREDG